MWKDTLQNHGELASLSWCLYKKYAGDEGYGPIVQDLKYDKTFKIGVKKAKTEEISGRSKTVYSTVFDQWETRRYKIRYSPWEYETLLPYWIFFLKAGF